MSDLLDLARGYEKWEANLIMDSRAWRTNDGLPHLTPELYNELMDLQEKRNAVIARDESSDLLGAAKAVWDARKEAFNGDSPVNPYGRLGQAMLTLRNAIEKAEGS